MARNLNFRRRITLMRTRCKHTHLHFYCDRIRRSDFSLIFKVTMEWRDWREMGSLCKSIVALMSRNLRRYQQRFFLSRRMENWTGSVFHNPLTFSVNRVEGNYTLLYSRLCPSIERNNGESAVMASGKIESKPCDKH